MQLQEQGRIDLDAPAGDYLRAYQLIPAKASFRPATVRDLLTHAAAVPQMPYPGRALVRLFAGEGLTEGGDSYGLGRPLRSLAEYYGVHGRRGAGLMAGQRGFDGGGRHVPAVPVCARGSCGLRTCRFSGGSQRAGFGSFVEVARSFASAAARVMARS